MAQLPPRVSSPSVIANPRLHYSAKKIATTAPRAVVVVYGHRAIPTDYSVERGAHGVADHASFTLPLAGGIDWSTVLKNPTAVDGAVVVEVYAGYPHDPMPGSTDIAQLKRRFLGIVDDYKVDGLTSEWTFTCSSLVTLLLAEKQTTLSQGQTTLQYLHAVAQQSGLNVDTSGLRAGFVPLTLHEVYAEDFVVGIHSIRPWQILQMCAEADDTDVWMKDDTIYYWSPTSENRKHVVLKYGQDLVELEGEHAPQFSKNIEIEVRTYSTKYKTAHSIRYLVSGDTVETTRTTAIKPDFGTLGMTVTSSSPTGTTVTNSTAVGGKYNTGQTTIPRETSKERYVFHKPNLTPAQADAYGKLKWLQFSRLEYRAKMRFPMTPEYLPFADIETVHELYGAPWQTFNTGSQIPYVDPDTSKAATAQIPAYFSRRITETFGNDAGWKMEIEALSHAPPNEAPL